MPKMGFKEYYESKERLRHAADSTVKVNEFYLLTKYCKIPIGEDKGEYISLKPKDRVEVFMEYLNADNAVVRKFFLLLEERKQISPSWGNSKLLKWLESSTVPVPVPYKENL